MLRHYLIVFLLISIFFCYTTSYTDVYTASSTCSCYFDEERSDCGCCVGDNACQCDEQYGHKCVPCGRGELCATGNFGPSIRTPATPPSIRTFATPSPSGPINTGLLSRIKPKTVSPAPLKGIVSWYGDSHAESAIEFFYVYPDSSVSPAEGSWDFSQVQSTLASIASRGKTALIQMAFVMPNQNDGQPYLPDWLKRKPDYKQRSRVVDGSTLYYPDHEAPSLKRHILAFWTAFAQQFDTDSRIFAVLATTFGHWAEAHIYRSEDSEVDYAIDVARDHLFPSKQFYHDTIAHIGAVFRQTKIILSIDFAEPFYSPYGNASYQPSLENINFGTFDGTFMLHSPYNAKNHQTLGSTRYRSAPVGGEIAIYDKVQSSWLNPQGDWKGVIFEREAAAHGVTYMLCATAWTYFDVSRIRQAADSIGYRLYVDAVVPYTDRTEVTISNRGIAPFYYQLTLMLQADSQRASDSSFPVPFQNGATVTITIRNVVNLAVARQINLSLISSRGGEVPYYI